MVGEAGLTFLGGLFMLESLQGRSMEFVQIPAKTVEFESGLRVPVGAFAVGKRCITVGDFRAFQAATGYLTVSETYGRKLYFDNELIEHLSREEKLNAIAFCMCFTDAARFCEWAGVRLPSEPEWLAAALLDERVYDIRAGEDCPWYDKRSRRFSFRHSEYALIQQAWEITATRLENDFVVWRRGPWFFREPDWRRDLHRVFKAPDETDLLTSFRVCLRNDSLGHGDAR